MKRYYAHYTFIYPDVLLKNIVVELDPDNSISNYYPFSRELSGTEFHSGVQLFIPSDLAHCIKIEDIYRLKPQLKELSGMDFLIRSFAV